jgi:hypothetical protein
VSFRSEFTIHPSLLLIIVVVVDQRRLTSGPQFIEVVHIPLIERR